MTGARRIGSSDRTELVPRERVHRPRALVGTKPSQVLHPLGHLGAVPVGAPEPRRMRPGLNATCFVFCAPGFWGDQSGDRNIGH